MDSKLIAANNAIIDLQKEVNRLKVELKERTDSYHVMKEERNKYLREAMRLEQEASNNSKD